MEDFAKKLRKAIGNADMSQKEFAEKIGVKKQQISKWTTGMAVPRSETIEKIAQTLGVPVSYFVGEDNSVSQQANGNSGSVSQSVAVGGGDVGAKLEVVAAKLDLILEKIRK